MKKHLNIIAILAFTFLFASCKKESMAQQPQPNYGNQNQQPCTNCPQNNPNQNPTQNTTWNPSYGDMKYELRAARLANPNFDGYAFAMKGNDGDVKWMDRDLDGICDVFPNRNTDGTFKTEYNKLLIQLDNGAIVEAAVNISHKNEFNKYAGGDPYRTFMVKVAMYVNYPFAVGAAPYNNGTLNFNAAPVKALYE